MDLISTQFKNSSVSYLATAPTEVSATIIFIHGFPFNKSIWHEQLKSLPKGVKGIAYDIRGYGESSSDHFFLSVDLFAQDLLALIDHLKLDNCILCGISMGGYIALRALELSKENIIGLVLSDTNCVADGNESKVKRFRSINQILAGEKNAFVEGFIKNVFTSTTLNDKPDVVKFLRSVILGTSDETICSTQLALAARTDTSNSLPDIKIPTLIIRGEDDKLMSEEQTMQLGGIVNSEIVLISNSGHLPNLENPADFNKSLNTFLSKHFLS